MFRKNKMIWLWFILSLAWIVSIDTYCKEDIAVSFNYVFHPTNSSINTTYDPLGLNTTTTPHTFSTKEAPRPQPSTPAPQIVDAGSIKLDTQAAPPIDPSKIQWDTPLVPAPTPELATRQSKTKNTTKDPLVYLFRTATAMILPIIGLLAILCLIKFVFSKLTSRIGKLSFNEYHFIGLKIQTYHRVIIVLLASIIACGQLFQISKNGLRGSGWILAVVSFGVLFIMSLNGITSIAPITLNPLERKKRTAESVNLVLRLGGVLIAALLLIWFMVGMAYTH